MVRHSRDAYALCSDHARSLIEDRGQRLRPQVQEGRTHARSLHQGAGGRHDRWHPAGGIINRHKLLWRVRLGNWVRFFLTPGNPSPHYLFSSAQGLLVGWVAPSIIQHSTTLEALLGCVLGELLCFLKALF